MKRDINLVREILFLVEAGGKQERPTLADEDIINYHFRLMTDVGLLACAEISENEWQVRLTWAGCELLEIIRNEARWAEVVRILDDMNCHSFEVAKKLAMRLME